MTRQLLLLDEIEFDAMALANMQLNATLVLL
jgi:hypothetical protein